MIAALNRIKGHREMENKNRFSIVLTYLMNTAGMKNYVLAQELQYDVSYISKWLSGKVIPAEKTEKQVLQGISHCISQNASPEGTELLMENYQVQSVKDLELEIYDHLVEECRYSRETKKENSGSTEGMVRFYPELSLTQYIKKMRHPILRRANALEIVAAMDLMAMAHEYRIDSIHLRESKADADEFHPDFHFGLVTRIDLDKWDCVYDTVFLINTLTQLSSVDFQLYSDDRAAGKNVFAIRDEFAISGILAGEEKCLSVITTEKKDEVNVLYWYVRELCARENLLFRRSSMKDMLLSNEYIRTLLSPNPRWLVGHMTEHFMPADLFEEVAEKLVKSSELANFATVDGLRKLYQTGQNVVSKAAIKLMFYEGAFSDMAMTGQLDFFNYKITLTAEQRIRYLENLLKFCEEHGEQQELRLVYGNLVSDFQYIANQCVFLSDMSSHLRLDSSMSSNNLMIINRADIQQVFERFYDSVWSKQGDMILSNRESISHYIRHIIQGAALLSHME